MKGTYGSITSFSFSATITSASSDSSVYPSGYVVTFSHPIIAASSFADIEFPLGNYTGELTWETTAGTLTVWFSKTPAGKAVNVMVHNGSQQAVTIS